MDLLEVILAIVREKLPPKIHSKYKAYICGGYSVSIHVKAGIYTIGWFALDERGGACLRSSTRLQGLDLADPQNTEEKIGEFIDNALTLMSLLGESMRGLAQHHLRL